MHDRIGIENTKERNLGDPFYNERRGNASYRQTVKQ